jgi:hypothetical protein
MADDKRTGLGGPVPSNDATGSLRRRLVIATELLADQAERERVAFELGWSSGYVTGYATGHDVAYERAHCELAADWAAMAREVRGTARDIDLDTRRWGPGGRAAFGRPRPGDYKGGPVAAW